MKYFLILLLFLSTSIVTAQDEYSEFIKKTKESEKVGIIIFTNGA